MNKKEIQKLWDQKIIRAFYLNPEYKNMYQLIDSFNLENHISISKLLELQLERFPLNMHKHLSLSPINFICSYMPNLGKFLWEKADIQKNSLININHINCSLEKTPSNLKYEHGDSEKNKKSLAAIGRKAIATNRMLDENKKTSLNWSKK